MGIIQLRNISNNSSSNVQTKITKIEGTVETILIRIQLPEPEILVAESPAAAERKIRKPMKTICLLDCVGKKINSILSTIIPEADQIVEVGTRVVEIREANKLTKVSKS